MIETKCRFCGRKMVVSSPRDHCRACAPKAAKRAREAARRARKRQERKTRSELALEIAERRRRQEEERRRQEEEEERRRREEEERRAIEAVLQRERERLTGEKECPRCAETIKAKAVVCRFCGYDYELGEIPGRSAQDSDSRVRPSLRRCPRCDSIRTRVSKISPTGWILIVIGLVASPALIGIPLIFFGTRQREERYTCPRCG